MPTNSTTLFDPVTGDLLPECRDAYLRGQLPAALVPTLEAYLKKSPIQTRIILGRYHELAGGARQQGRTLTAPVWVQQQLVFQSTRSKAGPLRRPVVRLALGLFGLLLLASVVQWIRNEPLVPAPMVAAVTRVASSASQATQRLVRQFSSPEPEAALANANKPTRVATRPLPKAAGAATRPVARPVRPLPLQPVSVAIVSSPDSATTQLPTAPLPTTLPVAGRGGVAARPAPAGMVHGRISDSEGRSLAGATVLVKGTTSATSTNSGGYYALDVPAGAMLQFGYAGCSDQMLPNTGTGTMNVVLQRQGKKSAARR